jgi:putative flippase GtrA
LSKLNSKRLIKFLLVGTLGVGINYIIYFPTRDLITMDFSLIGFIFHIDFMWFVGIGISALSNYILNELWTFSGNG